MRSSVSTLRNFDCAWLDNTKEVGKMAEASYDPQKVQAILQDYAETLEVLTINSKPLINDLTMAADRYKPLASQIVSVIESRLFEVPADVFLFMLSRVVCVYYCMFILFGGSFVYGVCVCAGRLAGRRRTRELCRARGADSFTARLSSPHTPYHI